MSFAALAPTKRVAPEQVAPDTWVIHHAQEALGQPMFVYHALSPWLSVVDPVKYGETCDRVQALGAKTIVTAHSPIITEDMSDQAFRILRNLPSVTPPPCPDHNVLQAILSGGD
jgi:hypothetical protein